MAHDGCHEQATTKLFVRVPQRLLHLRQEISHDFFGSAGDEVGVGVKNSGFSGWEKIKSNPTAYHPANSDNHNREGSGQRGPAEPNRCRHEWSKNAFAEPIELHIQRFSNTARLVSLHSCEGSPEVAGQNQKGFDQRSENNADHNNRDYAQDNADDAPD